MKSSDEILTAIYSDADSREILQTVFTFTTDAVRNGDLSEVSAVMTALDVDKAKPIIVVGMLRATSARKSFIPGWMALLDRIRTKLDADGNNATSILRGLGEIQKPSGFENDFDKLTGVHPSLQRP